MTDIFCLLSIMEHIPLEIHGNQVIISEGKLKGYIVGNLELTKPSDDPSRVIHVKFSSIELMRKFMRIVYPCNVTKFLTAHEIDWFEDGLVILIKRKDDGWDRIVNTTISSDTLIQSIGSNEPKTQSRYFNTVEDMCAYVLTCKLY